MLKSMTGYGISKGSEQGYSITIELRTLNSKFMDTNLKVPKAVLNKELEIRNIITAGLVRGKASLSVELKKVSDGSTDEVAVNSELFTAYFNKFKEMADSVGASQDDLFRLALHSPDVIGSDNSESDGVEEWELVKKYLKACIEHCNEFRISEGATLGNELAGYIENIGNYLDLIKEQDADRVGVIRERILGHIEEISQNEEFDKNRDEQAMISEIETVDISEEFVRLKSHLDYFKEMMEQPESQGKKLGFISQEIGREINTIGSKANFAAVQRHVVCMKDELEKIKEQLLNVL